MWDFSNQQTLQGRQKQEGKNEEGVQQAVSTPKNLGDDKERLAKAKGVLKQHLGRDKHKMLKDAKSWEEISENISSMERGDLLTLVKNCGVTLTANQERRMNRGVVAEQLNEQIFCIAVDHGPERTNSRRE